MSNLYITEYARCTIDALTDLPCGEEPAITTQKVSFSGTAGTSAAFNAETRFVRIHSDSVASIIFGTSPTATTSHPRIAAGVSEYFGVPAGKSYKVSAVDNT